jgi:peroxiredoxin
MAADGTGPRANWEVGEKDGKEFVRFKGDILLLVLLGVSLSLNVTLGWTIRGLRAATTGIGTGQPPTGMVVKSIQVKDLQGNPMSISFADSRVPAVIYVFRPACSWCAKNMRNLKTLVAAKGGNFRFVGISLQDQGVSEYVQSNGLTMPVFTQPDATAIEELHLNPTPQTIVIDINGKVIKNWAGAYQGAIKKEVESYFAINLPGLVH